MLLILKQYIALLFKGEYNDEKIISKSIIRCAKL